MEPQERRHNATERELHRRLSTALDHLAKRFE
jgi:hypothetical protein